VNRRSGRIRLLWLAIGGAAAYSGCDSFSRSSALEDSVTSPGPNEQTARLAPLPGFWSCGTAAGVCSCVSSRVDPSPSPGSCAPSGCCFVTSLGQCTCRLGQSQVSCQDLLQLLGAVERRPSCP
jgi:hypothetical protein